MSNLPQSDWILAGRFVDGDLPAREAAAAESRIKSDTEFAAAVEEIRAQSSLMSGLPNFKPSEDLADRTLQASLDQVKAIMGVWPIEQSANTVTPPAKQTSSDSFDWKSTAALVASLAGVLVVGAMLWQNNQPSSSNVAMSEVAAEAPMERVMHEKVASVEMDDSAIADAGNFESSSKGAPNAAPPMYVAGKGDASKGSGLPGKTADANEIAKVQAPPQQQALSGTPMKQTMGKRTRPKLDLAVNSSAPVDQIWYISQDINASRESVCDVLNLNRIQVQRDVPKQAQPATQESVEAFYVAATPKQMKLAMSQLSNNANIEMIQLPNGMNSPIADAIEQQFAQSKTSEFADAIKAAKPNMPLAFPIPATQAMAQQLYSNPLPRNMLSTGPVPPIVDSGSPIDGLTQSKEANIPKVEIASNARAKKSATPGANSRGADGGAGFGGLANTAEEEEPTASADLQAQQSLQAAMPAPQDAELGKYLDESDEQLRQYLILVRGGEEE